MFFDNKVMVFLVHKLDVCGHSITCEQHTVLLVTYDITHTHRCHTYPLTAAAYSAILHFGVCHHTPCHHYDNQYKYYTRNHYEVDFLIRKIQRNEEMQIMLPIYQLRSVKCAQHFSRHFSDWISRHTQDFLFIVLKHKC